jgi:hypothetical protein
MAGVSGMWAGPFGCLYRLLGCNNEGHRMNNRNLSRILSSWVFLRYDDELTSRRRSPVARGVTELELLEASRNGESGGLRRWHKGWWGWGEAS